MHSFSSLAMPTPPKKKPARPLRSSSIPTCARRLILKATTSSIGSCSRTISPNRTRSEEHTSELQSRQYLVCRLLLEKKKQKPKYPRLPHPFFPTRSPLILLTESYPMTSFNTTSSISYANTTALPSPPSIFFRHFHIV